MTLTEAKRQAGAAGAHAVLTMGGRVDLIAFATEFNGSPGWNYDPDYGSWGCLRCDDGGPFVSVFPCLN
jgi:hypothetical protein